MKRRNWISRKILEEKLGRKLKKGECCHHIDGNIENDSPENLEPLFRSEHNRLHFTGANRPKAREFS